jgi:hypothetical protein
MIARGEFGRMVAVQGGRIVSIPLDIPARGPRLIPSGHPVIAAARSVGTSFGEE